MIHGEFEVEADAGPLLAGAARRARGAGRRGRASEGDEVELAVPLNVAFVNPDLLEQLGLGPMLQGIGGEAQYNNDEQIDNQLRSVLFQVPGPGNPSECLDGRTLPECFRGVVDLGAIDIERGRDHGMPTYNELRAGVRAARRSARSRRSPASPPRRSRPIRSSTRATRSTTRTSSTSSQLLDVDGNAGRRSTPRRPRATAGPRRPPDHAGRAAARRSTARSNKVDAFVGMVAEPHVPGTEFGELQLAIWTRQFEALRDGDRFFYGNDPGLSLIRRRIWHRLPAQPGRHHRAQHRHPPRRAGRERLPDPARGGGDRRRRRRHRGWYDRPGSPGPPSSGPDAVPAVHPGRQLGRPAAVPAAGVTPTNEEAADRPAAEVPHHITTSPRPP